MNGYELGGGISEGPLLMELLRLDGKDDARRARTIAIDPKTNRTCHYWHAFVPSRLGWALGRFRTRAALHRKRQPLAVGREARCKVEAARRVQRLRLARAVQPGDRPPHHVLSVPREAGEQAWMVPNGEGPRDHPLLRSLNLGLYIP